MSKAKPVKRSVKIAGHATSVTLESEFWDCLRDLAGARGLSVNQMVAEIDCARGGNLSSAIRVFVLNELKRQARGTRTPGFDPDHSANGDPAIP